MQHPSLSRAASGRHVDLTACATEAHPAGVYGCACWDDGGSGHRAKTEEALIQAMQHGQLQGGSSDRRTLLVQVNFDVGLLILMEQERHNQV